MKQMGIDMSMFITADDDSTITEEQSDQFMDDFLELVVKYGWSAGGGYKLMDANGEDEEE